MDVNAHYNVYKNLPLVLVLSQTNLIQNLPTYSLKIHFIIILPSKPRCSSWPFCFRFSHQNPECISLLPCVCHMLCLPRPPWFDHPNNASWGLLIMKLIVMHCRFPHFFRFLNLDHLFSFSVCLSKQHVFLIHYSSVYYCMSSNLEDFTVLQCYTL